MFSSTFDSTQIFGSPLKQSKYIIDSDDKEDEDYFVIHKNTNKSNKTKYNPPLKIALTSSRDVSYTHKSKPKQKQKPEPEPEPEPEPSNWEQERLKKVYLYLYPTIQHFLWASAKIQQSIIKQIALTEYDEWDVENMFDKSMDNYRKKQKILKDEATTFLYNSTEPKSKTRPTKEKVVKKEKKEKKEYNDDHKWIEFVKTIKHHNPRLRYSEATIHASDYWDKKNHEPNQKYYDKYGDGKETKTEPKSKPLPIDSTLISDDITKAVKNITKSAIIDYKKSKSKPKKKKIKSEKKKQKERLYRKALSKKRKEQEKQRDKLYKKAETPYQQKLTTWLIRMKAYCNVLVNLESDITLTIDRKRKLPKNLLLSEVGQLIREIISEHPFIMNKLQKGESDDILTYNCNEIIKSLETLLEKSKKQPEQKSFKLSGLSQDKFGNYPTFIYGKNNASITLSVYKEILYLQDFTAQIDEDKPRARKGLAYEMLCRLVHKLIKHNYMDENKNIELSAVTLKELDTIEEVDASQKLLIKYYISKGFKPVRENDYTLGIKMYQPIKGFLKMCGELTKKQKNKLEEVIDITITPTQMKDEIDQMKERIKYMDDQYKHLDDYVVKDLPSVKTLETLKSLPKQEQKDDNTFINTFDRVYKKGDTIDDFLKDIQTKTSSKQTKYFYSPVRLLYDSVYLYALKNSDNDCGVVPLQYNRYNNHTLEFTIPIPSHNEGTMKTNDYTLSNILYSFIRCYNEKKILVIPIQIQFTVDDEKKGGHANMLIINYHNMTFERFEPSSQTQLYNHNYIDMLIESSIMEPIQKMLNVKFKYIRPYSECPDFKRVQDYEKEFRHDEKYKTSPVVSRGFCSAWSAFYMTVRLNYPSLSQGETLNKIYSYLDKTPQGMYNFIMNFINYQDDLLKKVGLDEHSKEFYFDSKTGALQNYKNSFEFRGIENKIENLIRNEWSRVTNIDSNELKKITSNKKSFDKYGKKTKKDLPNLISQFKKEQKGQEPKKKDKILGLDILSDGEGGLSYEYDKNNIYIQLRLHNMFHVSKTDELYLDIFNSQSDKDKPRAKKGLAYDMLCKIVSFAVNSGKIDSDKNISLTAQTMLDFDTVYEYENSQKKLVQYYKSKGFKNDPRIKSHNEFQIKMYQPIKSFLKMCGKLTKKQKNKLEEVIDITITPTQMKDEIEQLKQRSKDMDEKYKHLDDYVVPDLPKPTLKPKNKQKVITNENDIKSLIDTYKGMKTKRDLINIKKLFEHKYPNFTRTLMDAPLGDFYPTPLECLDNKIINNIIQDATHILEPSAGIGSMIYHAYKINPKLDITAFEYNSDLIPFLKQHYHKAQIYNENFLDNDIDLSNIDTIICNPPFTLGGDKRYYINFYFKCLDIMYKSKIKYRPVMIFLCPKGGLTEAGVEIDGGNVIDPFKIFDKLVSYKKICDISNMLGYDKPTQKEYSEFKKEGYSDNEFLSYLEEISPFQLLKIDNCKFRTTNIGVDIYICHGKIQQQITASIPQPVKKQKQKPEKKTKLKSGKDLFNYVENYEVLIDGRSTSAFNVYHSMEESEAVDLLKQLLTKKQLKILLDYILDNHYIFSTQFRYMTIRDRVMRALDMHIKDPPMPEKNYVKPKPKKKTTKQIKKIDSTLISDDISKAVKNITKSAISDYKKSKPKKERKKIDSTLISDDITKAVKNITKSAISDYKKSKPKKERKTAKSPWIQHVYNYMDEHNVSYKDAMKEAKASYNKVDNKYVSNKKEKVLVENTFTFEEQRKFYTKANVGGQLNGRDILNSLSNTYIRSRDSSNTIRNKLIKYAASLKGMKRRLDFYKGKDEQSNILLEIINSELKKISDLYTRGKNVGWTAKGSTKTGVKREKKPKASIIPVEQQLINILKDDMNIDIRMDNIKEVKKDGDNYTLLLQNVNLDNENILGIKMTWDEAGYQIQIFKLVHNEKYNRDMRMLHKKEFVYTNKVKDNN
jgi:hypothetical protein